MNGHDGVTHKIGAETGRRLRPDGSIDANARCAAALASMTAAQAGDVDKEGEIVDLLHARVVRAARRVRLATAIGRFRSDDVDAEEQLDLVIALLEGSL